MSLYLIEALLGCALLGFLSGLVGNFLVVRKMALFGDMVGHAVLPGVCIGFFLAAYEKNIYLIFVGALGAALCANALHEFFSNRLRIKTDASMAIILTGFYAIGSTMLSWLKNSGHANQTGLDRFLLGQASAMNRDDLQFALILTIVLLVVLIFFYKEFKAACFDQEFARASGLKPRLFLTLLSSLIAGTVIVSLQAVGVILACAFLIIPSATTTFFSQKLSHRLILGGFFGASAGFIGALVSQLHVKIPTGPSIILVSALMFAFAGFIGPQNGWLKRALRKKRRRLQHRLEDFLRATYYFYERDRINKVSIENIYNRCDLKDQKKFARLKKSLIRQKIIFHVDPRHVAFSTKGLTLAADMVRKHRLWELYLVQKMDFLPERVHHNAERVEHFITDAILKQIEESLVNPDIDPHGKKIPSLNDLKKHGVPGY